MKFSKQIRKARLARDKTQSEVAFMAGMPQQSYSLIESGRTNPRQATKDRIIKALEMDPDTLELLPYQPIIQYPPTRNQPLIDLWNWCGMKGREYAEDGEECCSEAMSDVMNEIHNLKEKYNL